MRTGRSKTMRVPETMANTPRSTSSPMKDTRPPSNGSVTDRGVREVEQNVDALRHSANLLLGQAARRRNYQAVVIRQPQHSGHFFRRTHGTRACRHFGRELGELRAYDIAVQRLNPEISDISYASIKSVYNPALTSQLVFDRL